MSEGNKKFDLEERTAVFGENIIILCKSIEKDIINSSIVRQLIRSSTSVGANYMEANGASSKKDFRNKIYICKKEAQETKHWLRMLSTSLSGRKKELRALWQEAHELTLIFHKITVTIKNVS